ncbi:MAG: 5-deoxy-glucuronate isomerase [Defluviitaleaceae bacterium]|nr:5-deoxy-glucuronate isomerase [Defluviitaleaceae bacterium]
MRLGYSALTKKNYSFKQHGSPDANLLGMDIGICRIKKNSINNYCFADDESAFLLLEGEAAFTCGTAGFEAARRSVFDELPSAFHVPCNTTVTVAANEDTKILLQRVTNPSWFAPVFYSQNNIGERILGGDALQGCSERVIRDIFNYENAPYSNMVMGEVVTLPGRWSSYPPHSHPQPEVYYYLFDKPQGFGVSFIGEKTKIVASGDVSIIPGGFTHPQCAAAGYAMYFCWMIRHLPGNPWSDRIVDPAHAWLENSDAEVWAKKSGDK